MSYKSVVPCLLLCALAQQTNAEPVVITDIHQDFPRFVQQSSNHREDTGAERALTLPPWVSRTLAVTNNPTPAYTKAEPNPWWQVDLRVRRNMDSVIIRPCRDEPFIFPILGASTTETQPTISCIPDYDLSGAWVLVSDRPFPAQPWNASVPYDLSALISRFPIESNGYRDVQQATVARTGRFLRIQFPPSMERALALEEVDIRGDDGMTDPVSEYNSGHDAYFPETLELLGYLSALRGHAGFADGEIARLQGRNRQLDSAVKKARSIAKRLENLEKNMRRADSLLRKAEVVTPLRAKARTFREALETTRQIVVSVLTKPARQVRMKMEEAHKILKTVDQLILEFRGRLRASMFWSGVEQTAVGGLYHCQIADPEDPTQLRNEPETELLEGYSLTRNTQFELSTINARTEDLGAVASELNHAIDRFERAVAQAVGKLNAFEKQLSSFEFQVNALTFQLDILEKALGQKICDPVLGKLCYSVNRALRDFNSIKKLFGIAYLERKLDDILNPVIEDLRKILIGEIPVPRIFPEIALDVPDHSLLQSDMGAWDDSIAELRELLKTPELPNCAAAGGVISPTDGEASEG